MQTPPEVALKSPVGPIAPRAVRTIGHRPPVVRLGLAFLSGPHGKSCGV